MRVSTSPSGVSSYPEEQSFEAWSKNYVRSLPSWGSPQGQRQAKSIVRESQLPPHLANGLHGGFIPEYILEQMVKNSSDPVARESALQTLQNLDEDEIRWKDVNELRAAREAFEQEFLRPQSGRGFTGRNVGPVDKFIAWLKKLWDSIFGSGKKSPDPKPNPTPSPTPAPGSASRYVYDAKNTNTLRKELRRKEGDAAVSDQDVDNAYEYAGRLRTFMKEVLGRNSLDNKGMNLHQTVHLGRNYNNAYWDGDEMAYGDGDGRVFGHFAQDSTVIHHELGHGIVQHHNKNGGLIYRDESGALNESFADINAVMMLHYMADVDVTQSTRDMWLIGAKTMVPYKDGKTGEMKYPALRSFLNEKAYENHPDIGTDRQPKHMKDKYTGGADSGGVHINSGIPNHAFYLAAHKMGGKVWETTYKVWYNALAEVPSNSTFKQYAFATVKAAIVMSKATNTKLKSEDVDHVIAAWNEVGVLTKADQGQIDRLKEALGHKTPGQGLKLAS